MRQQTTRRLGRTPARLTLAALIACATAAGPLAARSSIGTAYSLEGERVLYRELRTERWQDGTLVACEVDYLTPDGELFAEKSLRFEGDGMTPEFTFVDHREEFREGSRQLVGAVELFSGFGGEIERRRTSLPETAVIDAGFDRFIQNGLDRLASGERLEFDFAVPAQGRFVRFQVEKIGTTDYDGRPALALRMRPANLLIRLLVDPIRLVYGSDGRLREFAGISDIRDAEGKRHLARIVFEYPREDGLAEAGLGAG